MICEECRTELEPVMTICPSCGARVGGNAKRGQPDWREQVRQTVERHKQKRKLEQEKLDDGARQLSIFPDDAPEDDQNRRLRERNAEIRARVEERVSKRRLHDPGEIPIARGGTSAAAARKPRREPEPSELLESDEPDPELSQDAQAEDFADLALSRELDAGDETEAGPEPFDGFALASAGERVFAGLIDVVFVALIQLTLFYLTTHLVAQRFGVLPTSAIVAMGVVGALLAGGYFLFFWGLSGQTLGKLLTGARVVDRRGGALGFGRAGVRLFGTIVAALPLFAGFIGLWTDPSRRGWHDRIAGTKVVRG